MRHMLPAPERHWPESVMADLRPCPNCGSDRALPELVARDGRRVWEVVCPACRTRSAREAGHEGFEDAVARWNQRALRG